MRTMSADESALLAAVAADPASDLPRLVYADFLDDHGQPIRAEFIRLQCEIARLEVGPRAVVDANWRLWKRQQDLLDGHLPEVLGPAVFLNNDQPELTRGFVSAVSLHVRRFAELTSGSRSPLAELVPLPRVAVFRLATDPAAFADNTHALLVAEASAYDPSLGDEDERVTDWLGAGHISGRFDQLEVLDLSNCHIADWGLEVVTRVALPALHTLDLSQCSVTDVGLVGLLNSPLARRLARLILDGNPLGDQAAFELADRLAPVKTFRTLDFRRTQVTSAGQLALTSAFGSRCNLF